MSCRYESRLVFGHPIREPSSARARLEPASARSWKSAASNFCAPGKTQARSSRPHESDQQRLSDGSLSIQTLTGTLRFRPGIAGAEVALYRGVSPFELLPPGLKIALFPKLARRQRHFFELRPDAIFKVLNQAFAPRPVLRAICRNGSDNQSAAGGLHRRRNPTLRLPAPRCGRRVEWNSAEEITRYERAMAAEGISHHHTEHHCR